MFSSFKIKEIKFVPNEGEASIYPSGFYRDLEGVVWESFEGVWVNA